MQSQSMEKNVECSRITALIMGARVVEMNNGMIDNLVSSLMLGQFTELRLLGIILLISKCKLNLE